MNIFKKNVELEEARRNYMIPSSFFIPPPPKPGWTATKYLRLPYLAENKRSTKGLRVT